MVYVRHFTITRISCIILAIVLCNQPTGAEVPSSELMKVTLNQTEFRLNYWADGRSRPYRVQFIQDGLISNYFYNEEGYINLFRIGTMLWGVWYRSESIARVELLNPGGKLRRELRASENMAISTRHQPSLLHCLQCEAIWSTVCESHETIASGTACEVNAWKNGALFDHGTSRSLNTMCNVFTETCRKVSRADACEGQCTYIAVVTEPCGVSCYERGPCSPNPCLNGGTCSADVGGGHVCSCPEGFGGMACQTDTSSLAEFYIVLEYVGTWTDERKALFEAAAARWSQLITHVTCTGTSTLPAGQLLISAELKEIDGEGGVLGAAGPHTVAQRCPAVSLTGQMIFDEDDVDDIDDAGYLEGVIQHEMGHTLGLGILWEDCNSCYTDGSNEWTCQYAKEAYNDLAGNPSTSAAPLIELEGTTGTVCSHFDETLLGDELMTGWVETDGNMPLSKITAGALDDMGYVVDPTMVDDYILPSKRSSSEEGNDSRKGPRTQRGKELGPMGTSITVEVIDESGNIVERRPYIGMRTLISSGRHD